MQDAHRKYEMTLEQISKKNQFEKESKDNTNGSIIASLETKFRQQMKEQLDHSQKQVTDLNEKCKNLERDNRNLLNKLHLEQRDKMSDHGSMEKKVNDLLENEQRLINEIDELKQERDRRILEHQRALDKDRDSYKAKIQEVEQKSKEVDNKRSTMVFEFEKERAKWGLEKDFLVTQKQEVQEQLDRAQRKCEQLLKENERLKTDKNRKGYLYGQGGGQGLNNTGSSAVGGGVGGYAGKFNSTAFGQHLLKGAGMKENTPIGTSQAFASGFAKFIGDGGNDKSENTNNTSSTSYLPLSNNISNSIRGMLGSPNQPGLLGANLH